MSLPDLQELARDLDGLKISSLDEAPANSSGIPVRDRTAGPNDDIPYNRCLRAEIETLLGNAIAGMSEAARRVLIHDYFDGLAMKEVGSMLGVRESRVSQIHKAAIYKLREDLQKAFESSPGDEDQHTPPGEVPVTGTGDYKSHLRNEITECLGK
jgi:RNA polymerase sigma factor for flagellar operon FliA